MQKQELQSNPVIQFQPATAPPMDVADLIYDLLVRLGEDPHREGLEKTPERVSRMYTELLAGYQTDLDTLVNGAIFKADSHDMVVVRNIQYYSMCEHHLLPFFGRVHVAYIPDGEIIGLSKIPRLVELYARRLQVQERMTHQIGTTLDNIIHPLGVAVLAEGSHLCARMRGVRQNDADLMTSCMLGVFKTDAKIREDFFNLVKTP